MKKNNKNNWISYLLAVGIMLLICVIIPFILVKSKVKLFTHVIKIQEWGVFAILALIGIFISCMVHCIYMRYEKKEKVKEEPVFETFEESNTKTETVLPLVSQVANNVYQRGYLILQGKGGLSDRIYIGNNDFYIGRDGDLDLPININGISKKHALISKKSGTYCVMDTNSTNGTQVNQKQLHPLTDYPLQSGDLITFATARYYFYLEG